MNNFLIQFDMLRVDRMLTEYEVKKLKPLKNFLSFREAFRFAAQL